jgi:hypothetical protein
MANVMTDSEAYYRLTREWTNMHHTERTVLDKHELYRKALDAVVAGDMMYVTFLTSAMQTEAGKAWRAKHGISFSKSERLAPHGGCNWQGCNECFPNSQ